MISSANLVVEYSYTLYRRTKSLNQFSEYIILATECRINVANIKSADVFTKCAKYQIKQYINEVITSSAKCGVKLIIHSQTSTVASLKFGNR